MANVFTGRSNMPRTTSMADMAATAYLVHNWKIGDLKNKSRTPVLDEENKDFRGFQKTRRVMDLGRRFPASTNFTCGKMVSGKIGEIPDWNKLDISTTKRIAYQWPTYPEDVPLDRGTTRFGHTEHEMAALGIIPNNAASPYVRRASRTSMAQRMECRYDEYLKMLKESDVDKTSKRSRNQTST